MHHHVELRHVVNACARRGAEHDPCGLSVITHRCEILQPRAVGAASTLGSVFECSVRRCGDNDLQLVRAVHAAHGGLQLDGPSQDELDTWRRMMATVDLSIYIAERDGVPSGTATMMLMPNLTYRCAPTAFVEAVVVAPMFRRQGIARRMLAMILDDAAMAGCDKVQLLSHKRHVADGAHALYEGLGFVAEAEGFRRYLGTPEVRR